MKIDNYKTMIELTFIGAVAIMGFVLSLFTSMKDLGAGILVSALISFLSLLIPSLYGRHGGRKG